MINPNIKNISEPPIPLAISWSNEYDRRYGELIDMSQAVPSYPPHPKLIELSLIHISEPTRPY